jgi:hypothetical protein
VHSGRVLRLSASYAVPAPLMLTLVSPLCTATATETYELDLDLAWATRLGDVNSDSVVDTIHQLSFLIEFGCTGPACRYHFSGDSGTGSADLLVFVAGFGSSCVEYKGSSSVDVYDIRIKVGATRF